MAEAANGREALRAVADFQPDLLLLDVEMPVMNGLEVAAALHGQPAVLRILALSAHNDREYIEEMLRQGAAGYLIKDEAAPLLGEAVRGLMNGQTGWFSPQAAQLLEVLPLICIFSFPGPPVHTAGFFIPCICLLTKPTNSQTET